MDLTTDDRSFIHAAPLLPASPVPYESDIVSARPVHWLVGLAPAGYAFQHSGSFSPNCDCRYEDAAASAASGALVLGVKYPKLGFAVRVLFSHHSYDAVFSERGTRLARVVGPDPDTLLDVEKQSAVRHNSIRIQPMVAWYVPYSGLFVSGGIEIGIPLTARYDNHEHIRTPGFTYTDGTTTATLLEETDIPGGRRIGIGLTASLGYDVTLADWLIFTPLASVTLPMTPVSSQDDTWRVMTEQLHLILSLRL